MAILWGPTPYIETDTTNLPGSSLVKAIPINFTGFPGGAGALTLTVVSGEVQYDFGNFSGLTIVLGGTGPLYFDGTLLWNSDNGFSNPTTWADWLPVIALNPIPAFTSPGAGITNINLLANAGASAPTPAGYRNFTLQIEGGNPPPVATIENPPAGSIKKSDDLIFSATSASGLTAVTATVTNPLGNQYVAWTLANGFSSGVTGHVDSIANGFRVTIQKVGRWTAGALTLDIDARDAS
jgi:hypothetical protein